MHGEFPGARGLAGEVGVGAQQGQLPVRASPVNNPDHMGMQVFRVGKRPQAGGLGGDPGRILEDAPQNPQKPLLVQGIQLVDVHFFRRWTS